MLSPGDWSTILTTDSALVVGVSWNKSVEEEEEVFANLHFSLLSAATVALKLALDK